MLYPLFLYLYIIRFNLSVIVVKKEKYETRVKLFKITIEDIFIKWTERRSLYVHCTARFFSYELNLLLNFVIDIHKTYLDHFGSKNKRQD